MNFHVTSEFLRTYVSTHVSLTIRELREQFLSCINLCEQDVYLLASFGAFLRVEGVSVDVYIKNEEWKITGKECYQIHCKGLFIKAHKPGIFDHKT